MGEHTLALWAEMNPVTRGHRRSIRLPQHDYGEPGVYFIAVVAWGGEAIFGHIAGERMIADEAGRVVQATWEGLAHHFAGLALDTFVLMPNHIHGVVVIGPAAQTGLSLGRIVAYLKYQSTKGINNVRGTPGLPVWQRNYYEHVVRNGEELNRIREYVATNPLRWALDHENPGHGPRWFEPSGGKPDRAPAE
ncbi:MAG: transposase [Dehalococcoidales bacterium]|nr:transposase [Dehalococcoidales bacterium]